MKRLREAQGDAPPANMGPVSRVIALWSSHPDWRGPDGAPASLPCRGAHGRTFETLVAEVSRDVHPRSVLDVLLDEGGAALSEDGESVTLTADFYLPADRTRRLDYLGMNLGDHAEAAVSNVLAPEAPPFFERAAHFDGLSPDSLAALDRFAREEQTRSLRRIAERAMALQEADAGKAQATGRFRAGAFVYVTDTQDGDQAPEQEDEG